MNSIRFLLRCLLGYSVAFGHTAKSERYEAALDALDKKHTRLTLQQEAEEASRRG